MVEGPDLIIFNGQGGNGLFGDSAGGGRMTSIGPRFPKRGEPPRWTSSWGQSPSRDRSGLGTAFLGLADVVAESWPPCKGVRRVGRYCFCFRFSGFEANMGVLISKIPSEVQCLLKQYGLFLLHLFSWNYLYHNQPLISRRTLRNKLKLLDYDYIGFFLTASNISASQYPRTYQLTKYTRCYYTTKILLFGLCLNLFQKFRKL